MDISKYYKYCNPLEVKYANNNIKDFPIEIKDIFNILPKEKILNKLKYLTGINNLEGDPYLHGAGLHLYPNNGRLNIHLDYEIHPLSGKERRLNLILFLNKNWKNEYNGNLELFNKDGRKCLYSYSPSIFNRAILFKTTNNSWHGVTTKIKCPDYVYRKSLAYYWVSDITDKEVKKHRLKAYFKPNKNNKDYKDKIEKLCEIRVNQRITDDILKDVYPEWTVESL